MANIKSILYNKSISSKAFKLYCFIFEADLNSNPSCHSMDNIKEYFKEGRDAIRGAINELIKHGYIERFQTRKDNGQTSFTNYKILK